MTQKGQVTIPVEVRRMLGLRARDKVIFDVDPETGVATLRRAFGNVRDVFASVPPRQAPEDFRRVREEFEQGVADEVSSEDQ